MREIAEKPKRTRKNDTKDLATLATIYLNVRKCIGGRYVIEGFVCPHCESDSPQSRCGWAEVGR